MISLFNFFLILGFLLCFGFIATIIFLTIYDLLRNAFVKSFLPGIAEREEQELIEAYTLNEIYFILEDISGTNRTFTREELLFVMERFSEADYEDITLDIEECLDRAMEMGLIELSGKHLAVTDKGEEYIESYRMRR